MRANQPLVLCYHDLTLLFSFSLTPMVDSRSTEEPGDPSFNLTELTTKIAEVSTKTLSHTPTIKTFIAPIGIKLDDTNYAPWSQIVEMYIFGKDKLGYINRDLHQPSPTHQSFRNGALTMPLSKDGWLTHWNHH